MRAPVRLYRDRRGFSALELLLALAIMGVSMAILLPAASGWFDGGKYKATLKTATALAEAGRQYRQVNGTWPSTWAALSGRYLANTAPTTPWGVSFTLTSTAGYAEITTTVPLSSPPNGILPKMASLAASGPNTQLTFRVTIPGETADLSFECKRLTGSAC